MAYLHGAIASLAEYDNNPDATLDVAKEMLKHAKAIPRTTDGDIDRLVLSIVVISHTPVFESQCLRSLALPVVTDNQQQ